MAELGKSRQESVTYSKKYPSSWTQKKHTNHQYQGNVLPETLHVMSKVLNNIL
jgi:hypothetical protein